MELQERNGTEKKERKVRKKKEVCLTLAPFRDKSL